MTQQTRAPRTERRQSRTDQAVREALRVPGVPLDPATRERFEAAFDCDLGHVRIHTDALAARAAQTLDAAAFALGRDLFFSAAAYAPHDRRGSALIAHEVTHAIEDPRAIASSDLDGLEIVAEESATERNATEAASALEHAAGFVVTPAPAPRAKHPQIARLAAGLFLRDPRDPAQLIAMLTTMVKSALHKDPDDKLGRVRKSIAFLDEDTRKLALERLEHELLSPDWQHLNELLKDEPPAGTQDGDARENPPAAAEPEEEPQAGKAGPVGEVPAEAAAPEAASEAKPEGAKPAAGEAEAGAEKPGVPAAAGAHKMKIHAPRPRRKLGVPSSRRPVRPTHGGAPAAMPSPAMGEAPEAAPAEAPEAAPAEAAAAELVAGTEPVADAAPVAGGEPIAAAAGAEMGPSAEATTEAPAEQEAIPAPVAEATAPPTAEPEALSAPEPGTAAAPEPEVAAPESEAAAEPEAAASEPASNPEENSQPAEAGGPVSAEASEAPGPEATGTPPVGDLPAETDDNAEAPSGGGGGGSAIPEPSEEAAAPAPTEGEPSAVLGAVADQSPDKLGPALASVTSAVARTVGADRTELTAHPPELPADATARATASDQKAPAAAAASAAATLARVRAVAAPAPVAVPQPSEPAAAPEIRAPAVTSNSEGKLTSEDAQKVTQAVAGLPTTDPALDVKIAPAPDIELTGAADPSHATAQRDELARATSSASTDGKRDASQTMGEDHIEAKPLGKLRADAPAEAAAGDAPAAGAGPSAAPPEPAVVVVARERSTTEVQAAAQNGVTDLTQKRQAQHEKETQERADSQRAVDSAITDNVDQQQRARVEARTDVSTSRTQWRKDQDDLVTTTDAEGGKAVDKAQGDTKTLRDAAREEARQHTDKGNQDIATARTDAEKKASAERARAKQESDDAGFFSRAASAIGSFFDKIKGAIKGFFDAARDLVKKAIAAASKLVSDVIDKARNAIVAAIKAAGDVLIKLGDTMLAAFPSLRDRWRATIRKAVDKAVDTVNRLADDFKKAATALLNLLGKALTAILDAYQAFYLAAVDAIASTVKSALDAAKGLVAAIGTFAVLIRDIARNPGQWISNLGAALMDGVRNHLWTELKAAVKEWFNSKVEAVVGVGKMIFELLRKGGIAFRRVAAMVWAAVKAAIPRAIIEFLIQKVISMIVPAAGAIMAIIEGLQAAWATVSRIIAAFERFVAFLKAVKDGNAGQLFARAVAAAAVAVIDFTANFIISKIGKAAKGVGGKLKSIASKLMAWFRRGAKAVGKFVKGAARAVVRAVRAVGRGVRRAAHWVAGTRAFRALARTRVGKFVGRQVQRAKAGFARARERFKQWREKRRANKAKDDAQRLERAVTEIRPKLHGMLQKGVASARLRLTLLGWRISYGIRRLAVDGKSVVAANSPAQTVLMFVRYNAEEIFAIIRRIGYQLMNDPRVVAAEQELQRKRAAGQGTRQSPLQMSGGTELVGGARDIQQRMIEPGQGGGFRGEFLQVGAATPFYERQFGRSAGAVRTGTIGTYPKVQSAWADMSKTAKLDDASLAKGLQEFIRTGRPPDKLDARHQTQFAELARLMVSVEGGRSPSALVEAPMLLSLMSDPNQQISAERALGASGTSAQPSLNPVTMKGAFQGQRSADFQNILNAPLDPAATQGQRTIEANRAEVRERRVQLIATFIQHEMMVRGEAFDTTADVERFVRQQFEAALHAHIGETYGIDLGTAPTGLLYGARGEVVARVS